MPSKSENEVRKFVDRLLRSEEYQPYSKIKLPYGLELPGDDRAITLDAAGLTDLSGMAVLDVGCHYGAVTHLCAQRGARKAVGIEAQIPNYEIAQNIQDILQTPNLEIVLSDFEFNKPPRGKWNIVLALNVLHHFRRPIATLEKLGEYTASDEGSMLVLEWPTLAHYERIFGALPSKCGDYRLLVGDPIGGWHFTQPMLDTSLAVLCNFKTVDHIPSPKAPGERILTVCRR